MITDVDSTRCPSVLLPNIDAEHRGKIDLFGFSGISFLLKSDNSSIVCFSKDIAAVPALTDYTSF